MTALPDTTIKMESGGKRFTHNVLIIDLTPLLKTSFGLSLLSGVVTFSAGTSLTQDVPTFDLTFTRMLDKAIYYKWMQYPFNSPLKYWVWGDDMMGSNYGIDWFFEIPTFYQDFVFNPKLTITYTDKNTGIEESFGKSIYQRSFWKNTKISDGGLEKTAQYNAPVIGDIVGDYYHARNDETLATSTCVLGNGTTADEYEGSNALIDAREEWWFSFLPPKPKNAQIPAHDGFM